MCSAKNVRGGKQSAKLPTDPSTGSKYEGGRHLDERVDLVVDEEVDKVVDVQGAFLSAPIGPLVGPRKNGLVSCYWSSSTAPQYSV